MNISNQLIQTPGPGTRMVKFRGDVLTFKLGLPQPLEGTAWVRTNLGHGNITRTEIVAEVEQDKTRLGRDWFDIPMNRMDDRNFSVMLPLVEVGHFEAKCFFLKKGEPGPTWPEGGNTVINVEPADVCCANIIYNAFVRQFGPNKSGRQSLTTSQAEILQNLDSAGYTMIPPSGTFRDLIAELDFIIGRLGCRILMLLPIHPTPTTYGRMGRFGSPYAALNFTGVDPALAVFDVHATPLEQFIELVDATHQRNAKLFIDIAINHTGWAAGLHETHPDWLVRGPEGRIEVPGAWGVHWEDLTKLDYTRKDLWQYMADVFIAWCRRGVDGFRCDAGYMIPPAAWKYIVAKVRDRYPDTIFLLEGLGGKISVTRELLNSANLNWTYSELFQNYDRRQIEHYLPQPIEISGSDGTAVHFAETHDNPRLAARSKQYARMRTALCALCSHQGAFGFANGVEWFATEKIDVHDANSLNWGAQSNQVDHIRRLNLLLKVHPAFQDGSRLQMLQEGDGNNLVLLRQHSTSGKKLLVVVNLDDAGPGLASWNPIKAGLENRVLMDLLTGTEVTIAESGGLRTCALEPGQVLCLSAERDDLKLLQDLSEQLFLLPQRIETQRLRAKALEVFTYHRGYRDLADFDVARAAQRLKENPIAFCAGLNPHSEESRVISWQWPRDIRRRVMIPPGHFLLIRAEHPFRVQIYDAKQTVGLEDSLYGTKGFNFALFLPFAALPKAQSYTLKISVYLPDGCRHEEAHLLVLAPPDKVRAQRVFRRSELLRRNYLFLATNGYGAMLRAPVSWGRLTSRYDCLLAGNLSPDFPEDRWIMFTRCRAWLVFQGYSQDINSDCLEAFGLNAFSKGYWQYHIPTGQGEYALITAGAEMVAGENTVRISFLRHAAKPGGAMLSDKKAVKLILRPDIENRSFHETTKAYLGPEHRFPEAVTIRNDSFLFHPDDRHHLSLQVEGGTFVWEPEWQYMVHRAVDAERGMDPNSDLFSPGYFYTFLKENQQITLTASILSGRQSASRKSSKKERQTTPFEIEKEIRPRPLKVLEKSLNAYVADRGKLKTVIAGYPWFLDWGRDALIFTRGLIASKKTETARAILMQFGRFESQGTLPNMIVGNNAGNRDTSDAPLWFFAACADLIGKEGNDDFLDTECDGRSVGQILFSIGRSIINGTPNGIRMDSESGLVFSPAHFTWMDTNYPAGSPRQGYPIEIQALWYAALRLLARIDNRNRRQDWEKLSKKVQTSLLQYFWRDDPGYLSDCLHAASGHSPKQAEADDALRPNQLLAVTFGAVADQSRCRQILAACEELLVPGAIRSLADRSVRHPIEIVHNGKLLNDPHCPYRGKYIGDEDTQRKPAYHNGTAWTWLFPSFCEAWAMVYGEQGQETARGYLSSSICLLNQGCVGHIPEILDGDFPHTQRGCDAQAWGDSELLRVWHLLAAADRENEC
jgi:starch synthase (maltosyl-transferring)